MLVPCADLDSAVLDLAAVLEGLVADQFEIILVTNGEAVAVAELQARAPSLPLRVVESDRLSDGCDGARFDLLFVAATDGQFDVRELNHVLDGVESGADVAVGYRPRRSDAIVRRFQRWGWKVDVDCAFGLIRREVWQALRAADLVTSCCGEILANVRRLGYRIAEVPVSHRRPTLGTSQNWRAA